MVNQDYPSLYRSADDLSGRMQADYFRALFAQLFLYVLATILSSLNSSSQLAALIQALTLILALASTVYLFWKRPDRHWYSARAVAESIKTATWRFVTCAEPFNNTTDEDRRRFTLLLRDIVEQNRDIARRLDKFLDGVPVSDGMLSLRALDCTTRLSYYALNRIQEQQAWYASKTTYNNGMATKLFWLQVFANIVAIGLALGRIANHTAAFWPTDIVVTIAAGLLAWTQSKRFAQLAASYALAAHEISFIRDQVSSIKTEEELSRFVGDAENAFSREHTQWVARKDD